MARARRRAASAAAAGLALAALVFTAQSTLEPTGHCSIVWRGETALPDPTCTPGALNPDVTPATLRETICKPGWTATIRPGSSLTRRLRAQVLAGYGLRPDTAGELDHLVSLQLGGSPTSLANLWVEPGSIPNPKDTVENALRRAVCDGRTTLAQAQHAIATDWTTALAIVDRGRR